MSSTKQPSVECVTLTPVSTDQESIVANLLQLYYHDFSEMIGIKLQPNGRFASQPLPTWFNDPDLHPFLIMADDDLAGFVFVWRGSLISERKDVWDIREFFVARGFRRLGVGQRAAHLAWKRFPGDWEVRVIEQNPNALQFWSRTINAYAGKAIEPEVVEQDDLRMNVFSFQSPSEHE